MTAVALTVFVLAPIGVSLVLLLILVRDEVRNRKRRQP